MANCQNNMCYSRRPMQSAQTARNVRRQRTDGCPDTHDHFPAGMPIAMAYVPWQKWQDIYEPDYLYPGDRSSSSSQSESSSSEASSSSEESSSEPESSAVAFGQPVPESERVTSAYFDDAVFIGDSLTTGIQLYNILPDTTVLASVGININNIFTNEVISDGNGGQQTILDAAKDIQPAKIYTMLGTSWCSSSRLTTRTASSMSSR